MKKIFLIAILPVILFSCSGSDKYQGKWYALDRESKQFELTFSPKNFSVTDSTGVAKDYSYTQNSIKTQNSVVTYGIQLSDSRSYLITFPNSDNADVAVLADGNGSLLFTLGRKRYVTYDEIYGLAL